LVFGDFEVEQRADGLYWELGHGAMGVTYLAADKVLRGRVALKVIEVPEAARGSQSVRERFLREARAAFETGLTQDEKPGALEGLGFGLGGVMTLLPDMGVLATITIRLLQKLSLLYGFNYRTEDEEVELWMAAASAAGLDLGRDFLEKQAIEKLVPRIIDRIAVKAGAELAEEWVGRFVPLVSAGLAGGLNYYFVRSWGRRAQPSMRRPARRRWTDSKSKADRSPRRDKSKPPTSAG